MARRIDLLATTRNGPTAIDGLHPGHDLGEISGDGQITAHQFLQGSQTVVSVIDGVEMIEPQQFGQPARIDPVILAACPHMEAFFRGTHTTNLVTCGLNRSYNQAAEDPSSNVTCNSPRNPSVNCRKCSLLSR